MASAVPALLIFTGMILSYSLVVLNRMRINKAYPLTQVILKEVGGTMPRPIVTRAKRGEKWFITREGYMTPQFQWSKMLSDTFILSYWKSQNNIYPCMIKIKEPFTNIKNLISSITKPEYKEAIKTPQGTFEAAKVTEGDDGTALVSANYAIVFPKESAEVKAIVDDNIKDVVVDLWKANTERFSWADWFSKWAPILGHGVLLIGYFVMLIVAVKMIAAYEEAIVQGITITIEGTIPSIVPPPTPTPTTPPGY